MASSSSSGAERAGAARRFAVADLGSNSFRLVVFSHEPAVWWRRTDEIYEPVRIGAGLARSGRLGAKRMARALRTIEAFAHFCRASGLDPGEVVAVATSAVRDAENGREFVARAHEASGLEVRRLEREEEARYGYLAAINSTTLNEGAVLDLGGGSLQLVESEGRRSGACASWALGSVRMTERFLPGEETTKKQLKALRTHVREQLAEAPWLARSGDRLVGVGGTVRNLAAAAQAAGGLPSFGVQGFVLTREALGELVAELAERPAAKRGALPGIKPERGDVILAGAVVIETVLEAGDFAAIEVTEAGLREGVFFERHLAGTDPPQFASVREAGVRNLAHQYPTDPVHVEHVATLALRLFDDLGDAGLHPADPAERELLWAAAMLHDVGMTVDYDDHHKHSRYLILNAVLPGFSPRETGLVAQAARYHRKGVPGFGELAPLMEEDDEARLLRLSALLRLAEQLERARDQTVRDARAVVSDGQVRLELVAREDVSVARWAAERQAELFAQAFGRELAIAV